MTDSLALDQWFRLPALLFTCSPALLLYFFGRRRKNRGERI